MLKFLFTIGCIIVAMSNAYYLNPEQQRSIRRILSNPNTPSPIKVKTRNIVYEKYHVWAQNICSEYLKKRSYTNLREDLKQCVSAGLLLAIDKYDWKQPSSFPNYARKYVLGSVCSGIETLCRTRNQIDFVAPANQWIFDKYTATTTAEVNHHVSEDPRVSKDDILRILDPEERRLFEYVYGHTFNDQNEEKRSVAEICDLMAYGNRETYRIRKTRMFKKILGMSQTPKPIE